MTLRYLSVCSGIEAASVAWHGLGWTPGAFAEVEAFPSAVLAHRFPGVPNWGDMTKFKEWPDADIDILVGGTPCQSFSVAGLRKGLEDPRGSLMLTYLAIARRYRPRYVVWENVPGVLSSNGGRDFGTFLGALGDLGYGWAYRVLDAQWFGVPQRRRRVFVVGYLGDAGRAAEVLFERESVRRDSPPRREAGQRAAPTLAARTRGGGGLGTDFDCDGGLIADARWPAEVAPTLNAAFGEKQGLEDQHALGGAGLFVAHAFDARQSDVVQYGDRAGLLDTDGHSQAVLAFKPGQSEAAGGTFVTEDYAPTLQAQNNGSTAVPAIAFTAKDHGADAGPTAPTLRAMGHAGSHPNGGGQVAVAIQERAVAEGSSGPGGKGWQENVAYTLEARHRPQNVGHAMQVRRLTPVECERLQGFPDGWTDIPWRGKPTAPDGPRYKALGNSMAVPCMRWIGERIHDGDPLS